MKITRKNQVFNMMNTNGRRADVINAYTIYMEILDDLQQTETDSSFTSFPNSLNQFKFYEEAISRSPEVFKNTNKYDQFVEFLGNNSEYKKAFEDLDEDSFKNLPKGKKLLIDLDKNLEARARHYTSNLSKIGFVYSDRSFTPVGKAFVNGSEYSKDLFESILPIDNINLIFLRQLAKLRIYNNDCSTYYSPMNLAIYILLNFDNVKSNNLLEAIQSVSPYKKIDPDYILDLIEQDETERLMDDYLDLENEDSYIVLIENPDTLKKAEFNSIFKNRKTSKTVDEYYDFYLSLTDFLNSNSISDLQSLESIYVNSSDKINKAFNFGKKLFYFPESLYSDNSNNVLESFYELNEDNPFLKQTENINLIFLEQYLKSKRYDDVQEYSDTLERLLKVTGIISFKNGIASLEWKNLWEIFFDKDELKISIFNDSNKIEYSNYENKENAFYFRNVPLQIIYNIDDYEMESKIDLINVQYGVSTSQEVSEVIENQTNNKFIEFIEENYPVDRLIYLLKLFSDRTNDQTIKNETNSLASVPTIFEYLIGIAWYHLSDESYDVFSSFRLTMNADFIPETHAGGGDGDIIIDYFDRIVMLEVTLMNKQAQKRGEWEPVLRHATNLTIENPNKEVTTFFIADELDPNTINIWRAVAMVPLESSRITISGDEKVQGVTIMPLDNEDFIALLDEDVNSNKLIRIVRNSFDSLPKNFDTTWREKITKSLFS